METSDSETNTVLSIENEETEPVDDLEESTYITNVRNSVRDWKLREMDANTSETSKANGLGGLRSYVAKTAQLFYDLQTYLNTSKNKEKNMADVLYVSIVEAIGIPATLNQHIRRLLEHFLQRDLVELPLTVEPTVINSYAQKGLEVKTEFPDEE